MQPPAEKVREWLLRNHGSQSLEGGRSARIIITISGIPGSGKTTVARELADALNAIDPGSAVAIGLDGFHYTRKQLDDFEDSAKAHKFRGAPYTFNAQRALDLIVELHENKGPVKVPVFDHATKDPVEGAIIIETTVKYVFYEGLYLHLTDEPWNRIKDYSSDIWRVEVDESIARDRLAKRHLASGIVSTLEEGYERADFNDMPNGKYILSHSYPPNFIIRTD